MASAQHLSDQAAELLKLALDQPAGSARLAMIEQALRLHRQAQEARDEADETGRPRLAWS